MTPDLTRRTTRRIALGVVAAALTLTACAGASSVGDTPRPSSTDTQPATGRGSGNFSDPNVLSETILNRLESNGGTPTDVICTATAVALQFSCAITDQAHPWADNTTIVTVTPDLSGYTASTPSFQ